MSSSSRSSGGSFPTEVAVSACPKTQSDQSHSRTAATASEKVGWDLPGQRVPRTRLTHARYAEQLLPSQRYFERDYRDDKARPLLPWEMPSPLNPTRDAIQNLILSIPSGTVTWASADPVKGTGAVAGSHVVFASGARVLILSH